MASVGSNTVTGKVLDTEGQPFVDCLIRVIRVELSASTLTDATTLVHESPLGVTGTDTTTGSDITTDKDGTYKMTFTILPGPGRQRTINVRIAAYEGTLDAPGKELASSPVITSLRTTETIDIVIDRANGGPSEFERLSDQIKSILDGSSLALKDLKDDRDITFLSRNTRQPTDRIAFISSANRLTNDGTSVSNLKPEIYYAFFREGLPSQLPDLLREGPEVQRRALEEAIKKNTIPSFGSNESIDQVLESVVQLIVARAIESQQQDGTNTKTSLGQLLSTIKSIDRTTVLDATTQKAFLTEYINAGPSNLAISDFWKKLKLKPDFSAYADNIEFTFQLATLTMNHLPLVQELQRMRSASEITSLSDLARFGQKDWQEIISRQISNPTSGSPIIGFPPNIPGNDDNEKTANYTRVLARMVEDISPVVFIASSLEKESNDDSIPDKQDLVTFLKANTEFDFKSTRLQSYLAGKPHAFDNLTPTISDVEGTKIRIRAMQRLYKVAPHYDQWGVLMKDGLDSANAIARMGQNAFVTKYGDALGGSAAAKSVHDKALEVQAKATSLLAEYGLASYKVSMSALHDEAQTAVDGIPEWSTLFGSLDLCKCEDCRSVYSPAAYFVDVLHFLKDRPSKIVGSSAKDILFERRPDLGEIELTCENTNTTLPYVDLVNEILENNVSPFPPFPPKPPSPFSDVLDPALENDLNSRTVSDALRKAFNYPGYQLSPDALISVGGSGQPWTLDEPWWSIDDAAFTYTIRKENSGTNPQLQVVSRSLQTKGSSSERGANPQYINTGAYETLSQSVFPWMSLPFNLWNEEVNVYLRHLGVRRHQIMETFLPGDRRAILNNPAVACAYLDISRSLIPPNLDISESSLITGATSSQPGASSPGVWNLWGFSAETLSIQNSIPDPSDSTRRITTGNWLDTITKRVDVFLQQSGLTYYELLDLLDTVFINPPTSVTGGSTSSGGSDSIAGSRVIKISSKDPHDQSTCEIAKLQLSALENNNLNQDTVQKIMQFVRLWRKLDGWTMRDLDRAISTLKPGGKVEQLDEGFISQLSHIQRLRLRLNLPIINILSFWAPIDTASYYVDHDAPGQPNAPSLYDMVFRNKTVSQTPDPTFTEKPDDKWVNGTLSEHAAAISSSLGISTADFQLLLLSPKVVPRSTAGGTEPDDKLNLNHLSCLYRHSTLAKMMKIPIRDYISLLDLAGVYNVHLKSLPSSFSFPPELAGSIRYDSTNKKIIASRFFPVSERTLLLSLSNDQNYNDTIKALFKLQDEARTQEPFGSTEDTILFIENVDRVNASPLSIEELVYLLLPPPNGTTSSSSSPLLAPTEEAIAAVLDEIRAELQRIATENTFNKEPDTDPKSLTADPNNSSLTRQKLSLLNWDSALIDQVIATISDGVKYQVELLPSEVDLKILNDTGVYKVDLASLPAGFSFPSAIGNYVRYDSAAKILVASRILSEQERVLLSSASSDQSYIDAVKTLFTLQDDPGLQGKISYDQNNHKLEFDGIMTLARQSRLKNASADEPYVNAIDALFDAPRNFVSRYMRIFSIQNYSTDLAALPAGVQFPKNLRNKVYFDAVAKQLHFFGPMLETERDLLLSLSTEEVYRKAVNDLFSISLENYSTDLAALPAGVQFPKNLRNKVYFDAVAKQLHFFGPMLETERDLLLSLSTEEVYRKAVNDLFSISLEHSKADDSDTFLTDADSSFMFDNPTTIEKRFEVLLKKLLPHLQKSLSESLVKQKIAENLNLEYTVADELLTRYVTSPTHSESKSIAEFVPTPPNFSARSFVESNLNIKLNQSTFPDQFNTFILLHKVASFITKFQISIKQLVWIFEYGPSIGWLDLNKLPLHAQDPSASFDSWLRLVELVRLRDSLPSGEAILDEIFSLARAQSTMPQIILERLAQYTRWDLTDLQFLVDKQGFNFLPPQSTDLTAFKDERAPARIWDCFVLINGLKMPAEKCRALAEPWVKKDANTAITAAIAIALIAIARSVRQSVRERYDDQDQWLSVAKPLRDILREKQRNSLVEYLVTHLKIPIPILQSPHPTLSISDSTWRNHIVVPSEAVKELQQKLNAAGNEPPLLVDGIFDQTTRNAVVSFQQINGILPNDGVVGPQTWSVLDTVGRSLRDKNDLYAHFLIDVEMNPCMITSRIKQALSSMQLFVQRSLMNLEEGVQGSSEVDMRWLDWKWMKNYRVWEANRKIFLYPENWIEPELRDDKSPFFSELDSDLFQGELTNEVAENALMSYLAKLDQVARLEIVGMYHQVELGYDGSSTAIDTLHVFGRTMGTPHVYYYRQQASASQWTPWEKVDLDIEGDQLIPLIWNRRLYLFWPTFTAGGSTDPNNMEPTSYNVQIAWSEREQNSKWSAKKLSSTPLGDPFGNPDPSQANKPDGYKFEPSSFIVRSRIDEYNNLYIIVFFPNPYTYGPPAILKKSTPYSIKAFKFNGCNDDPEPLAGGFGILNGSWQFLSLLESLTGTYTHGEFLMELARDIDNSPLYLPASSDSSALALTPGNFYLLPPHDGSKLNYHASFYMDNTRTFLLHPREVVPQGYWWKTGEIDPLFVQQIPTRYFEIKPSQIGRASTLPGVMATTAGDFSNTFEPYHKRNLYRFQTFYHPYVCAFISELNRNGIDGLLQRRIQIEPQSFLPQLSSGQISLPLDFQKEYAPTPIVTDPYPFEDVDFEYTEAYALYNWELFFHIPLMIADRLSKGQRFEEAQKWFHRIFNPTDTSSLPAPQRYWNTKPFYNTTQQDYQKQQIQTMLNLLAAGGDPVKRAQFSVEELATLQEFENSVDEWRRNPFEPHLIARLRSTSYQKTVVMKYIDNLIAWGDQLFRSDTIESINEATQLYIMAAEILGRRPQEIPPRAVPITQSYNTLEPVLDKFSNALIGIEEFISPSGGQDGAAGSSNLGQQPPQVTLPTMLYFCVPKNDILLGYWDTVADRLFKIRHCMNIQGVVRQLPLFEPPIDPALLVKAAAAGIDISSVLNDIDAALPYYRFSVLVQKASELCSELKSLGAALLAALEKKDAEELALIRAEQETSLLNLVKLVKQKQYDEVVQNEAALQKSRDVSVEKYKYYQQLLGAQDTKVPAEGETIPDQAYPQQANTQGGSVPMTPNEEIEIQHLKKSQDWQEYASFYEVAASLFHILPDFQVGLLGQDVMFGGSHIGSAYQAVAGVFRALSSYYSFAATMSARTGQYIMRANEWALQSNLAAKEIMQIDKQIVAANTRIDIANTELSNHLKQIENAQQIEDFMRSKYTNQELYSWMVGQVSTVYFNSYQLAYDVAKRAETAYRFELGLDDSNFIQFGYWDSLKRGLLAGERLYQDLKRMEVAYLDQNQREYEITKHVSILQLDPLALAQLKQTGECFISIPEALFDLDFPGHYLRRIKYVSITVPCVTGPYVGVNCTLTLLKSSIRHDNSLISEKYLRQDVDSRFADNAGAIQSIVTSSGQNDSGLFETNLRDERYLPFEGSGAISDWHIRLPRDFRQFDYDTISDVILHVRYTARDGGEPLSNHASSDLRDTLNKFLRTDGQKGLALPVSLRHEFPSEWYRFLNPPQDSIGDATLTMSLGPERFPFMFQGRSITISDIELFVKITPEFASTYNESTLKLSLASGNTTNQLEMTPWNGLLRATRSQSGPIGGLGNWTLTAAVSGSGSGTERINPKAIEDILVICLYSV